VAVWGGGGGTTVETRQNWGGVERDPWWSEYNVRPGIKDPGFESRSYPITLFTHVHQ
jgi:hypothetical protein